MRFTSSFKPTPAVTYLRHSLNINFEFIKKEAMDQSETNRLTSAVLPRMTGKWRCGKSPQVPRNEPLSSNHNGAFLGLRRLCAPIFAVPCGQCYSRLRNLLLKETP